MGHTTGIGHDKGMDIRPGLVMLRDWTYDWDGVSYGIGHATGIGHVKGLDIRPGLDTLR